MENEGAVAEPVTEVAPEGEAAAPAAEGAGKAATKTYDEKAVSDIVSKRVNELNTKHKPWQDLADAGYKPEQIREIMGKQAAAAAASGKPVEPELTPQDKAFREYAQKVLGLDKLPKAEDVAQLKEFAQYQLTERAKELTRSNVAYVATLAKEAGFDPKHNAIVDELTASSLKSNAEDLKKYQQGDPAAMKEIIAKHFAEAKKFLDGYANGAKASYAKDKAKQAGLAPRMPAGGVTAPTSKQKKLSNEEFLAAAHKRFTEGPAPE